MIELIDHMGNDQSVVNAARVSYGGGTRQVRDDKALINYLMANGHMSPFEFVEFTFRVRAPIFVARQWFRHRTGNYAEVSGRYSVVEEEAYTPRAAEIRMGAVQQHNQKVDPLNLEREYKTAVKSSFESYRRLLAAGVVREQARAVLPQGAMTRFYFKIDLRNLFNFLKQRLNRHAQLEIRMYAERIIELITPIVPHSVEAWENFVFESVSLSGKEWGKLIDSFGKDALLDALVGTEPSKSRTKWLEDRIDRATAFRPIRGE